MKEIESIYKILEEKYSVTENQLKIKDNTREATNIKRIISLVLLNNTDFTLEKIGKIIGRDHSSVSHYKDTTVSIMKTEKNLKKDYDYVEDRFNEMVYGINLTTKLKKLLKDKDNIENEISKISEAIKTEEKEVIF